jgi:hypothetical protein
VWRGLVTVDSLRRLGVGPRRRRSGGPGLGFLHALAERVAVVPPHLLAQGASSLACGSGVGVAVQEQARLPFGFPRPAVAGRRVGGAAGHGGRLGSPAGQGQHRRPPPGGFGVAGGELQRQLRIEVGPVRVGGGREREVAGPAGEAERVSRIDLP